MGGFQFPILSVIIFTPIVAAVVMLFIDKEKRDLIRGIAITAAAIILVLGAAVFFGYNSRVTDLTKEQATLTTAFGGANTVNNGGLIDVLIGTLDMGCGGANTGVFNVASGATLKFSGGIKSIDTGASFTGTGSVQVTNVTMNFNTTVSIAQFAQSGGTVGGTGTLTITGSFAWSGGAN